MRQDLRPPFGLAPVIPKGSDPSRSASHGASAPSKSTIHPISVRGLSVSIGQKPVLRSLTFDVPEGKLVGIVGPNGAGKSTLLKAMLGLVEADGGSILIEGQPVRRARQRVAFVPQSEAVDWDFPVTVFDVVVMGRYGRMSWFARPTKSDRQAAAKALDQVSMGEFSRRHIRQLSGGQQKRVFLARALCQEADILLLDEPFAGVDAATEQAIFQLMDRLTAQGKTLLVVNHDLSILDRFDLMLLLNQRVISFGPTAQVVTDENLRRTYGGRLTLLERADQALQDGVGRM